MRRRTTCALAPPASPATAKSSAAPTTATLRRSSRRCRPSGTACGCRSSAQTRQVGKWACRDTRGTRGQQGCVLCGRAGRGRLCASRCQVPRRLDHLPPRAYVLAACAALPPLRVQPAAMQYPAVLKLSQLVWTLLELALMGLGLALAVYAWLAATSRLAALAGVGGVVLQVRAAWHWHRGSSSMCMHVHAQP